VISQEEDSAAYLDNVLMQQDPPRSADSGSGDLLGLLAFAPLAIGPIEEPARMLHGGYDFLVL